MTPSMDMLNHEDEAIRNAFYRIYPAKAAAGSAVFHELDAAVVEKIASSTKPRCSQTYSHAEPFLQQRTHRFAAREVQRA